MTEANRSLELMLGCLSPSQFEDACLAFSKAGASTPIVIWSPDRIQLMHPLIERFWNLCRERLRVDGQLYAEDLNLADFDTLVDWLMVLRVDPANDSFVYAHYGKGIAEHFGRDMSGRSTTDFGGHISEFFTAAYREVRRQRQWLLTDHEPPRQIFVCSWRRLIVPLVGGQDRITGFIAINVPESPLRAGLDMVPEPLLVLDSSQNVRFANAFARSLFGIDATTGHECRFDSLTGIPLNPPDTPEGMFAQSIVDNRIRQLRISDRLLDDFLITISGAVHSGKAYYIVMLRILTGDEAPESGA